jgi:hypothetical protein
VTRAKYGDQRACRLCGHDIEFHGKPRREEILPGLTMIRGGWMDRGGDRFCPPDYNKRLHKPYRD